MPDLINFGHGKMKPVATHEELFEFCNEVRKAGGGEVLDALLPGYVGDAKTCLIAKNLNFECQVQPYYPTENGSDIDGGWIMVIEDHHVLRSIAKNLGLTVGARWSAKEYQPGVVLPEHIGNAASAFDSALAFTELRN